MQPVVAAHKLGGKQGFGRAVHLLRRALLLDLAVIQQQDAVGNRHRLVLVVGHHQRRQAQLDDQLTQENARLFPQLGVEVRQRLIQQDHRRVVNQRAANGNALLLSARELMRMALAQMAQPQLGKYVLHPLINLRGSDLTQLQRVGHIFEHRFMRPERVGLKHQPEVALFRRDLTARRPGIHLIFANNDTALRRLFQPGNGAQQRGFTAAGRPKQ